MENGGSSQKRLPPVFSKLSDHEVSEVNIIRYAEARAEELIAMDEASAKVLRNKRAAQSMPFYMRRRAASHNIKRLPRRLRARAAKEIKDDPPKKTKRPSRKHRRRPSNLLQEYNRRKKAFMWLETHIWHAKRFHMQKQWGYNVPNFPNDKSTRACYRAHMQHCVMWDLSYLVCLEIVGPQMSIIEGFKGITSPDSGAVVGSVAYINGSVEGMTFLYHHCQYPRGAIGPATFLWKPCVTSEEINGETRTLWLWIHPTTYSEVLVELQSVFSAVQLSPTGSNRETKGKKSLSHSKKPSKTVQVDKNISKYPDIEPVVYKGPLVTIVSLKDNLCRFRLTGPESLSILTDVLPPAEVSGESNESTTSESDSYYWWEEFFNTNNNREIHRQQASAWAQIAKLPNGLYLPPSTVLGLTVSDPRLRLPPKRIKMTHAMMCETELTTPSRNEKDQCFHWPGVSYSPLWEMEVRRKVKNIRLSEHEINARRGEHLLPGEPLELGREESRIPVLLIQRPGQIQDSPPVQAQWSVGLNDEGGGWDLILPGGWAMAFWIALVYRGARVGGVRELVSSDFEQGLMHFPDFNPDTQAGRTAADVKKKELEEEYAKRPPAKRPNYNKLGVAHPFRCPWEAICRLNKCGVESESDRTGNTEQSTIVSSSSLFVLRSRTHIAALRSLLGSNSKQIQNMHRLGLEESKACLVAVQITMLSRGTCASFASIHFPSETDLDKLAVDPNYEGPVEKVHQEVKSGLVATTVKSVGANEEQVHLNALEAEREVCGCVCDGGFSLHLGRGAGIGYVTLHSLYRLIDSQSTGKTLGLVRCPTSRQYRFVHLSILPHSKLVQL